MKIVQRNYMVLLLLSLLFAAPGLSAYLFYKHPVWLGDAKTNKGVLLNPPLLLTLKNAPTARHKWQLVLWSPYACKKSCIRQLDQLARIRLALGRRLYEVDARLLMGANALPLPKQLENVLHAQDIHVEKLSERDHQILFGLQHHQAIFIANPDAYLVLSYPAVVNSDDIYRDIKKLLTE